ncbi:hypothetical protein LI328DRAFT_9532 [Trichoderma asperelloides]|nr:hypothetical protein LI328DRAFT_9532 [Trichoderma asperelloides]
MAPAGLGANATICQGLFSARLSAALVEKLRFQALRNSPFNSPKNHFFHNSTVLQDMGETASLPAFRGLRGLGAGPMTCCQHAMLSADSTNDGTGERLRPRPDGIGCEPETSGTTDESDEMSTWLPAYCTSARSGLAASQDYLGPQSAEIGAGYHAISNCPHIATTLCVTGELEGHSYLLVTSRYEQVLDKRRHLTLLYHSSSLAQYPDYTMDDFVCFSLQGCKKNQSLTQRRLQSSSFSCQ